MGTPKRYFTRLELIHLADSLGFVLEMTVNRMLRLTSKTDPEVWGTVIDMITGKPVVGFRHYNIDGWRAALPWNIKRLEEEAGGPKKMSNGH